MFTRLIDQLIDSLKVLPGVGAKSAQRMAFFLLERNRDGALKLSSALAEAMEKVGRCEQCQTFSEEPLCQLCSNERRNKQVLCVVEMPGDIIAIEQSGGFNGQYFVLMGRLSPIEGIGPDEIGIHRLISRIKQGHIEELILAVSPTMEGEATVHYIADSLKDTTLKITRIAHGVPIGGELEFVDGNTLAHAFGGRRAIV